MNGNAAELIQWVAANLDGEPDMASCPGMDAYSLMSKCRQFPQFATEFWKSMYTKLVPSRSQLDNEEEEAGIDGEDTIRVLDKIADIAAKRKVSTTV